MHLQAASADKHESPVVVGQTFLAGSQDPTKGSTGWSLTSHGISENLFTVDKTGNIVGVVAKSVKKISEFVWEVTLKEGVKFSDGNPVTGQAVADCLSELNKVNDAAKTELSTMTVTAPTNAMVGHASCLRNWCCLRDRCASCLSPPSAALHSRKHPQLMIRAIEQHTGIDAIAQPLTLRLVARVGAYRCGSSLRARPM